MAKVIKRNSYKFFAVVLLLSLFGFYFSLIDQSNAAQVTERSDTLDNAASSATSNHTFQFTLRNSLETVGWNSSTGETASDTISITFDPDFTMGTIDCGDVDLTFVDGSSASSIAGYNVNRNTSTYCVSSATSWGLAISGNTLTFHTPTSVQTYVATNTIMTVRVGSNAIFQDTGAEWVTNPIQSLAGLQTMTIAGTFEGTGSIPVVTLSGVEVSATIAETLTFTLTGLPGHTGVAGTNIMTFCGNNLANPGADDDDSETVTMVTTTATTVPFGTLTNLALIYQGCQKLSITTNAGNGYTIRTRENNPLKSGALTIADASCDSNGCLNTPSTSAAFTVGGGGEGFGISCTHTTTSQSCSTTEPAFGDSPGGSVTSGVYFAPVANEGVGLTPAKFSGLTVATSIEIVAKAKYRLKAPASQGAGTYTNILSFIATPTF